MPGDNAAHGGQPDAGTFEFIRAVQTLKHTEQSSGIGHVEANPVVADKNHRFGGPAGQRPDLDSRLLQRPGELQGVGDQVGQNDPQHGHISSNRGQVVDAPLNGPTGSIRLEFLDDVAHQALQLHLLD